LKPIQPSLFLKCKHISLYNNLHRFVRNYTWWYILFWLKHNFIIIGYVIILLFFSCHELTSKLLWYSLKIYSTIRKIAPVFYMWGSILRMYDLNFGCVNRAVCTDGIHWFNNISSLNEVDQCQGCRVLDLNPTWSKFLHFSIWSIFKCEYMLVLWN